MVTRRQLLAGTGAAALDLAIGQPVGRALGTLRIGVSGRPLNVLFILADDMRMDELRFLSFWKDGSWQRYATAISNTPLCAPCRTSILTGRYASEYGVFRTPDGYKMDDRNTVAAVMQRHGYRTALVGKYLNMFPWDRAATYVPPGWDSWRAEGSPWDPGHSVVRRTKAGAEWINSLPIAQPWFLYLGLAEPHLPATPLAEFASAPVTLAPLPPNFDEVDVSDKPLMVRQKPRVTQLQIETTKQDRATKARSLYGVDRYVGQLLANLRASGRLNDTLVVFTSDNGFGFYSHRILHKDFPYDEMIRMPFLVRYPGVAAGTVWGQISFVDLPETFASVAGASMRPYGGRGISLLAKFGAPASHGINRKWIYIEGPRPPEVTWAGVRSSSWKYTRWENGDEELYDLVNDPYEMRSLHADPAYGMAKEAAKAKFRELAPPTTVVTV